MIRALLFSLILCTLVPAQTSSGRTGLPDSHPWRTYLKYEKYLGKGMFGKVDLYEVKIFWGGGEVEGKEEPIDLSESNIDRLSLARGNLTPGMYVAVKEMEIPVPSA